MLNRTDVTEAMNLDFHGVRKALEEGGYFENIDIFNSEFVGVYGSFREPYPIIFMYTIYFRNPDTEDGTDEGKVHLCYNEEGILAGSY